MPDNMPEVAYYAGKLGGEAAEVFQVMMEEFPRRSDARNPKTPNLERVARELCDVLWYFARIVESPEVRLRVAPFLVRAEQYSVGLDHFDHQVVLMYLCGTLQEAIFKSYRNNGKAVHDIAELGLLLHYVAWAIYRSAKAINMSVADIARIGIQKQRVRIEQGTVAGTGSDR